MESKWLSLSEIARRIGYHRETIHRWIVYGDKKTGITLSAYRTPGGWRTTMENVYRFVEMLGDSRLTPPVPQSEIQRQAKRAEAEIPEGWD